jgi:hypothetical protein
MKLKVDYPTVDSLLTILNRTTRTEPKVDAFRTSGRFLK